MSLALIQESAKEVRRLAIAGSPLAVGDFRLKKLLGPLEQAGAKLPVFAQVAKSMGELVNGNESESAGRLLALSTLLNAILYTQGQTGAEGDFAQLEALPTNCTTTRMGARVLKPLRAALLNSGAGRFEMIKSAAERGLFNDLRLMEPAILALGDNYAEIAELVAEKVLPAYGPGIIPRLKASLDLKGKKSDVRKLMVIHRLDPDGTVELCKTALEDGAPEVKAAAITCLGQHQECLPLVMEQSNSKNKLLRAAALEALARHDRPEITKLFGDLIKGGALGVLVGPFRAIRNKQVLNSLLKEGGSAFEALLKGDEEQVPRFVEVLDCLKGRDDPETEAFALACFNACDALMRLKAPKAKKSPLTSFTTGAELVERLARLLCEIGSPKSLEAVVAKRDVLPVPAFAQVLDCALRIWPAERIYQEFGGLLGETRGVGKQKSEILQQAMLISCGGVAFEYGYEPAASEECAKVIWDPRWLGVAIKADQPLCVCCLATPGHTGAIEYLLKTVGGKNQVQSGLLLRTLARCQYPNVTDLFLELVTQKTKGARYLDYDLQVLLEAAKYLPAADLPKMDAFAPKLDEKFVDQYLEALGPLRLAKQSPQN